MQVVSLRLEQVPRKKHVLVKENMMAWGMPGCPVKLDSTCVTHTLKGLDLSRRDNPHNLLDETFYTRPWYFIHQVGGIFLANKNTRPRSNTDAGQFLQNEPTLIGHTGINQGLFRLKVKDVTMPRTVKRIDALSDFHGCCLLPGVDGSYNTI
ncbi:hypothetical protein AGMMS49546_10980 [Spirochaetia bacterium]|nr:hypothetical protein AGMMS49546_10980 [Spirochaetia bacterium]